MHEHSRIGSKHPDNLLKDDGSGDPNLADGICPAAVTVGYNYHPLAEAVLEIAENLLDVVASGVHLDDILGRALGQVVDLTGQVGPHRWNVRECQVRRTSRRSEGRLDVPSGIFQRKINEDGCFESMEARVAERIPTVGANLRQHGGYFGLSFSPTPESGSCQWPM